MSGLKETLKMDDRVLAYKQGLYEKTLEHLKNTIPNKIVEFQTLAESYSRETTLFGAKSVDESNNTSIDVKKRKLEFDSVASISIDDLAKTNTRHYIELIEIFSCIRGWISLNVPRVEDGNNFGVDVQEDVISQLTKLEDAYTSLLEQAESYFLHRAATVKKALKHKEIDAFRHAIIQQDEKEMIRFHFSYFDLANNYAVTWSLIVKNFAKIETPRPAYGNQLF
eukprot:gene219-267_t